MYRGDVTNLALQHAIELELERREVQPTKARHGRESLQAGAQLGHLAGLLDGRARTGCGAGHSRRRHCRRSGGQILCAILVADVDEPGAGQQRCAIRSGHNGSGGGVFCPGTTAAQYPVLQSGSFAAVAVPLLRCQ